jgi:hypothetical protein
MLDDVIDSVAREITAAAPPEYLRTRVLARLAERAPRRRLIAIVVPALALIVAVVLLKVAWRVEPKHTPAQITRASPPSVPPIRGATTDVAAEQAPSRAASTTAPVPLRRAPAPPRVDAHDAIALAPLTVDSITLPAIVPVETETPETIGVAPLTVTPLPAVTPEGR